MQNSKVNGQTIHWNFLVTPVKGDFNTSLINIAMDNGGICVVEAPKLDSICVAAMHGRIWVR